MFNHELLVAYATGNANSQEKAVAEKHLSQCLHCRKEVMSFEHSWWTLDVWQGEIEEVKPRFTNLRRQIEESKKQEPVSLRWKEVVYRTLPRFHFRPALAFAAVATALILFPWTQNDTVPIMASSPADHASTRVAQETAPVTNVSYKTEADRQKETDFKIALQESMQSQKKQEPFIELGESGNLKTANLVKFGYLPSSNVAPAYQVDENTHRPTAINVSFREPFTR